MINLREVQRFRDTLATLAEPYCGRLRDVYFALCDMRVFRELESVPLPHRFSVGSLSSSEGDGVVLFLVTGCCNTGLEIGFSLDCLPDGTHLLAAWLGDDGYCLSYAASALGIVNSPVIVVGTDFAVEVSRIVKEYDSVLMSDLFQASFMNGELPELPEPANLSMFSLSLSKRGKPPKS